MPPLIFICALPPRLDDDESSAEQREQLHRQNNVQLNDSLRSWQEKDAKAWYGRVYVAETAREKKHLYQWRTRLANERADSIQYARCVDDKHVVQHVHALLSKVEKEEEWSFADKFEENIERMREQQQQPSRLKRGGPRKRLLLDDDIVKTKLVHKRAKRSPLQHRAWRQVTTNDCSAKHQKYCN